MIVFIHTNIIIDPRPIAHQWPLWLNLLLVFLTGVYVWIYYNYQKRLSQYSNAFFTSRAVNQLFREESAGYSRLSIVLSLFFFLSFSLFVLESLLIYDASIVYRFQNSFFLWLSIIAFAFVVYQFKLTIIRSLGFIFKKVGYSEEYIFNISFFNQNLGLFLFPIVICMAFVQLLSIDILFYIGFALIALVFLYRLFRSVPWGMVSNIISVFYLFLYLCTLEILPLVVLVKAFVGKI